MVSSFRMDGFRLEHIVSRTFQKWVQDHEDEIDECELNIPKQEFASNISCICCSDYDCRPSRPG